MKTETGRPTKAGQCLEVSLVMSNQTDWIYLKRHGYISTMTKRLVDVDDQLLHDAQVALGTSGLKDTVNEALSLASADSEERLSQIRQAFADAASVAYTDEDRSDAWR